MRSVAACLKTLGVVVDRFTSEHPITLRNEIVTFGPIKYRATLNERAQKAFNAGLRIHANCLSKLHCVRPAFTIYADISQHPSLLQRNRTVGQENTFTLTALQRITFCGFHVLRG
jgi:hypothetical protein